MSLAGFPLWAIVLVACATVPFLIRAWVDAEQRRAKAKTVSLLQRLGGASATGPQHAASIEQVDSIDTTAIDPSIERDDVRTDERVDEAVSHAHLEDGDEAPARTSGGESPISTSALAARTKREAAQK